MAANPTIKQLFELGAHFGHKKQRSFPEARRYSFGVRDGIFIINLEETQRLLEAAKQAIKELARERKTVLFVGTKQQARPAIEAVGAQLGMPYVSAKWLGGTLTNFETLRQNVKRLGELKAKEQAGDFEKLTKLERRRTQDQLQKLQLRFGGLEHLDGLPDALFVVDTQEEKTAVLEARTLEIPIFAIVDTNANPDLVDYPIPANDDAPKAVAFILEQIAGAYAEGQRLAKPPKEPSKEIKEMSDEH